MTDGTTISSAAKEIEHQYGHLDSLVNNAGITGSFRGAPSEVTVDQLREVYDTNVFGVVAVTNAMLPLRRSQAGRYTATDLNNHRGYRTVEQGAVIAALLATLGADGPTGTFQDENGPVPGNTSLVAVPW